MTKGILNEQMNRIYEAKTLEECKRIALDIVEPSKIRAQDKRIMVQKINSINNLPGLQYYLTNSFFKFNKMGLK